MPTEKDLRLCMKFSNGQLQQAPPPAWFEKHLLRTAEPDADWERSLTDIGLIGYDVIGRNETITIYKTPDGGHFIDYSDVSEGAAWIFIDRPVDYVVFRATILAPLVMLSVEADRQAQAEIAARAGAR